jgi:O-antigen ligase
VLLTGSRGALLAFLIVFFVQVCFMFANTKHNLRNIFAIGFLLVLLLVVFDAVLSQMPESVARRYSWDYLSEKGTTGRTEIWKFFLRHFSGDSIGRMLFGHGYGTSTLINTMNELVAHNLYLENLITLGIFGMFLQLIIQGTVVWILFKRRQHALLGAYLGMMVMCLSLSLVAYKPIWNVMLLALAIDTHHKNSGLASQSGKSIREYNPQEVLHESHT